MIPSHVLILCTVTTAS